MAIQNLSQHAQHLKSLDETIQEIDVSYQQVIDSHKQTDNRLREIAVSHKQTYSVLCDLSNLIFGLFQVAKDLREIHLAFEKEQKGI
jgi:ABC-type transporter Mla subunit MlaD